MSNFKEKYEATMIEHRQDSYGELSFEAGVKFALREVINTLWTFGIDETTKKMMVRDMLTEINKKG